jgi:SNF family Na+-dependent transporter
MAAHGGGRRADFRNQRIECTSRVSGLQFVPDHSIISAENENGVPTSEATMSGGGGRGSVEKWGSKIGVILAVAGSAVGLGNFLRFPGEAAKYGGGAFMIPYFITLLIVGIPLGWAEWTMGRYGGRFGFNSAPGIFSVLWRRTFSKYFGILALLIPVVIYMFYVYVESWCLAYAYNYALAAVGGGGLDLGRNPAAYREFFVHLTGNDGHGNVFRGENFTGVRQIVWFTAITMLVNFYLIYRGLTKGIEAFCKYAMPLLIVAAIVIVGRVLTLPEQPVPDPWHQTLPNALPADRWQKLHASVCHPSTTAETIQQELAAAFQEYFAGLKQPVGSSAPQTVLAMPPAGFLGRPDGLIVSMAEIRDAETGRTYRDWIKQARAKLGDDQKRRLQRLEREQLDIESKSRAAKSTKSPSSADVSEKLARLTKRLGELQAERTAILAAAGSMPSLLAAITSVKSSDPPTEPEAKLLQERSAALEVAELPRSVWNGLGYMWNPNFGDLLQFEVWIAAAGQIFFSLSVGFGIILCYASYLRQNDDVVLSALTASSTNEFCEVILGGLIAIPATFLFLGTATTLDVIQSGSSFGLGFNTLPAVFASMPAGMAFGAVWFVLLFLAAITSSISMLQPAIAFLEEGFGLGRRASVAALGLMTTSGSLAVMYFSENVIVLDTMNFWVGSVAIYMLATVQVIVFAWVVGVDRGFEEAHRGADMRIPNIFRFILKYVTPIYLLAIFVAWFVQSVGDYARAMLDNPPVLLTVLYLGIVALFLGLLIGLAGEQWEKRGLGIREVAK